MKKDTEFTNLAPIDNIENGEEYLNTLHWAIKQKNVKNIALAGPYGSGKSSIIETYLKKHKIIKWKTLRISMATFIENQTDEVVEFIVFRYLPSYKNQSEMIKNDKEIIER